MRERLDRSGVVNYQTLRSNDEWADHRARTLVTAALIAWLRPNSIVDPACGDGSIVLRAATLWAPERLHLFDISKPNIDHVIACGPPSSSIFMHAARRDIIEGLEVEADLIVLTEILEHLEDPDAVLRLARRKGQRLIASSPEMLSGQIDTNPEHLWMFDRAGYREMLVGAGWEHIEQYTYLAFESIYDYGIWVCS